MRCQESRAVQPAKLQSLHHTLTAFALIRSKQHRFDNKAQPSCSFQRHVPPPSPPPHTHQPYRSPVAFQPTPPPPHTHTAPLWHSNQDLIHDLPPPLPPTSSLKKATTVTSTHLRSDNQQSPSRNTEYRMHLSCNCREYRAVANCVLVPADTVLISTVLQI